MKRLLLAPLRGITDKTFRTQFLKHFGGFDHAMAPFITTVNAEKVAPSHLRDIEIAPDDMPLVPQIIGNNPDHLLVLARAIAERGYSEINLNLGCPFVKITRKRRGSGLLPHREHICRILDTLTNQAQFSLSIKLRLGLRDKEEILHLLPLLEDYPLSSITIHPRTATQMYSGAVDLEAFSQALQCTSHPVIYNGDITDLDSFNRVFSRFGERVFAWMIGRGVVANPLLILDIKESTHHPVLEHIDKIEAFHEDLFDSYKKVMYGPIPLLGRMKEIWKQWASAFPMQQRFIKKILKTRDPDTYQSYVVRIFGSFH